jgi:hypothetical protein
MMGLSCLGDVSQISHAHAQLVTANGVIIIPPRDFGHTSRQYLAMCGLIKYRGITSIQNFNKFPQAIPEL